MKAYSYKDSGIEWLGEIPSHWKADRIKDKTLSLVGGDWGSDLDSKDEGDPVIILRVADLEGINFSSSNLTIRKIKESSYESRKVTDKSLIIEKSGGGEKQLVGRVGNPSSIKTNAICSNFMANITFDNTVDISFMSYMFSCLYNAKLQYSFIQQTTGIQNLNVNYYLTRHIPIPPLSEQKEIVDFLDKATARIDRIINIKKEQSSKLEKAYSSECFKILTVGTEKNPVLVDVNVGWFVRMPEKWRVKRLKDVVSMKSGNTISAIEIDKIGSYPVYGGNGLRGYTESFTHEGQYPLMGRQGALCGNINYAEGKFFATEHAVVIRPINNTNIVWVGELMRIMNLNQYSNAAAQPGLSVDKIKQLYIPVPPKNEQEEIAKVLKSLEMKTTNMLKNIDAQIKTLQDYRKSLIHECVTGKKQVTDRVE